MQLIDLHIDGFGRYREFDIAFRPGINVIYGQNEAGKTTLHIFLRAMLYGIDSHPGRSGKKALYERFRPWEMPAVYKGTLRIEHRGEILRIERDFSIAPDDLKVCYETTGRRAEDGEGVLREALNDLSETAFINTACIGQLSAATGRGMAEEIRRLVSNLQSTGTVNLSADKALEYLKKKKSALKRELDESAVRRYTGTMGTIRNLETELENPSNENRLLTISEEQKEVKAKLSRLEMEIDELGEKLRITEAILLKAGIDSETAIDRYLQKAKELFETIGSYKEKTERKTKKILAAICMELAVAVVILAYKTGIRKPLVYGAGAVVVVLLAAAAAMLVRFSGDKKKLRSLYEDAEELPGFEAAVPVEKESGSQQGVAEKKKGSETLPSEGTAATDAEKETETEYLDPYQRALKRYEKHLENLRTVCHSRNEQSDELKQLKQTRSELRDQAENLSEGLEEQRSRFSIVEQKLTELNSLKSSAQELDRQVSESGQIRTQIDAMDLAMERLTELSEKIKNCAGVYLNRQAGRYITEITNGRYTNMDISNEMQIRLYTDTRVVTVQELSSGTSDQIYLAMRLAAVRLAEGEGEPLPLLMDDSFVQFDDERMEKAVRFVVEEFGNQIVLFSCQKREAKILSEAGIGYNYIEL